VWRTTAQLSFVGSGVTVCRGVVFVRRMAAPTSGVVVDAFTTALVPLGSLSWNAGGEEGRLRSVRVVLGVVLGVLSLQPAVTPLMHGACACVRSCRWPPTTTLFSRQSSRMAP
jgi:hypothetical protein